MDERRATKIGCSERTIKGTGTSGKALVMGILERKGRHTTSRVRARVIKETTKAVLHAEVRAAVSPGSTLFTDSAAAYRGLGTDFKHEVVDHAVEYVRGQVHTNGIENFWSF